MNSTSRLLTGGSIVVKYHVQVWFLLDIERFRNLYLNDSLYPIIVKDRFNKKSLSAGELMAEGIKRGIEASLLCMRKLSLMVPKMMDRQQWT